MILFFVNTITSDVHRAKLGLDGTYVYLNCKELPDGFKANKVAVAMRGIELFIDKIEAIHSDGMFSHHKLHCKFISNEVGSFIDRSSVLGEQWMYIKQ